MANQLGRAVRPTQGGSMYGIPVLDDVAARRALLTLWLYGYNIGELADGLTIDRDMLECAVRDHAIQLKQKKRRRR